jgi:hypothetical protein
MTQYTDTEVYYVSYGWGTCGSFVSSLLYDFLFGIEEIIPFSKEGNSHGRLINCYKNWDVTEKYSSQVIKRSAGPVYDHVRPINKDIPLIIFDHFFPVFDDLFSVYPKCKLIIISSTPQDAQRIRGNIFYKVFKDMRMRKELEFDKNQPDTVRLAGEFMNVNIKCPEQYSKNVNVLPMYDIIHNKMRTLTLLSQVTNKPITEKIIETYDKYIEAQEELVRTKMPWVKV